MEMRLSERDKKEIADLRTEHEIYADSLTAEEIKKEYINLRANQEWLMKQTLHARQKLKVQEDINRDQYIETIYYLDALAAYEWEGSRLSD